MIVRSGVPPHGRDVHPPLVGERATPDVRRAVVQRDVGDPRHELREGRQRPESAFAEAAQPHLELERRDHGAEVRISTPLAVAVDGPLHVPRSAADGGDRVGRSASRVVVGVNPDRHAVNRGHAPYDVLDHPGESAPVRIAEDDCLCSSARGRAHGLEGVPGVGCEAVEEVLRVVDDTPPLRHEEGDALLDHPEVLVQRGPEDVGDVESPALPEQRAHVGARVDERPQPRVVLRGLPTRRVEPKATIFVCHSRSFARAKNSASFGFDPGHPASTNGSPSPSSRAAICSLSFAERRIPSPCVPSRSVVS